MKIKHFIILFAFVSFSSCIVKSLKPFYITEAIEFQENLLGKWKDQGNDVWEISSIKKQFEIEKADISITLSENDLKFYEKFKDGYFLTYTQESKGESTENNFIAIAFKVKDIILVDFLPYYLGEINNALPQLHLLRTHSVAKLDIVNDDQLKLTWLDEDRLNDLYENKRIKLDREFVGFGDAESDFVLTASSKELYQFLEKYIDSNIENKWESDTKFTLSKIGNVGEPLKAH